MKDNKNRNKFTKDIERGIVNISMLCMLINRRTDRCVFFHDMANCEHIEVSIRRSKKEHEKDIVEFRIYYDRSSKLSWVVDGIDRLERINECIEYLQNILIHEKIDFSSLTKNYETVPTGYTL